MSIEIILLAALLLVSIIILVLVLARNNQPTPDLKYKIENLLTEISRIETAVKNEMVVNRKETLDNAQHMREELARSLKDFGAMITSNNTNIHTLQKENFLALLNKQSEQNSLTTARLDQLRETLTTIFPLYKHNSATSCSWQAMQGEMQ